MSTPYAHERTKRIEALQSCPEHICELSFIDSYTCEMLREDLFFKEP